MAFVTVRPKGGKKTDPTLVVDEAWITRWPDDFDVVEDAEETAEHASVNTIGDTDPAIRDRF